MTRGSDTEALPGLNRALPATQLPELFDHGFDAANQTQTHETQ